MGRFIGEDPIGFTAEDTNLYRYVLNAPIQGTDPMGLRVVTPVPAPVATPWYVPLLRRIPQAIPFVIPGGLLNPQRTNPYEFPSDIPCKDGKKKETCQTKFPHLIPCKNLPKRYLFPSAEDAQNAAFPGGERKGGARAEKGPCSIGSGYEPGYHWNVKDRRTGKQLGSVGQCECCEETPMPHSKTKGAVLSSEPH